MRPSAYLCLCQRTADNSLHFCADEGIMVWKYPQGIQSNQDQPWIHITYVLDKAMTLPCTTKPVPSLKPLAPASIVVIISYSEVNACLLLIATCFFAIGSMLRFAYK
jgi:hypothetical protein